MAEFVQLRKEKWTEPLSLLSKLGLVTASEFRSITKNLDDFQYKIQSQHRKLEDILAFIQYECNLLLLIKLRREGLKQLESTEEVDRFIYNEIRSQFGSAEVNFRHNIEFWDAKLRFISDFVPDQDKESEIDLAFNKALDNCGKVNLDFYRDCVDYLWILASKPPLVIQPMKRKKRESRRNLAKLMSIIRNYTNKALQNLKNNPEASIWYLTTELKYLEALRQEQEYLQDNPDAHSGFDIDEELTKSEKLITIIYNDFVEKHPNSPEVYMLLYEAVKRLPLMEATTLARKAYNAVLSTKNRSNDVFTWLLERSVDEQNTDQFIERVNQALAVSSKKVDMLEICLDKMDDFIEILAQSDPVSLPKILNLYCQLVDKDNTEWALVPSEKLQCSRLNLINYLGVYLEDKKPDDGLFTELMLFLNEHKLDKIVQRFYSKFPTSYVLAEAKIQECLQDPTKTRPGVIIHILEGIDWRKTKSSRTAKFVKVVYLAFLTNRKLFEEFDKFIYLSPIKVPPIVDIRLCHLKKLYMEDVEAATKMYNLLRPENNDWRLAHEVIKVETCMCRANLKPSITLKNAYEDAVRLAGLETEPWKICMQSMCDLGQELEASNLLNRAEKHFKAINKSECFQEELLPFSKRFAAAARSH